MIENNHIRKASFLASMQPSPRTGKRWLYIALGSVVSICVVCLLAIAILGPRRISPKQLLAFGVKGRAPGMLYHPSYIGLDGRGNIYIADWGDGRINVFDPTGKFLRLINVGADTNILGMAVAPDGTVYISYDGKIHRLDAQGHDTTLVYTDSNGDQAGEISGIALGSDGSLAAADNRGDILRFGPDGTAKLLLPRAYSLPSFTIRSELEPHSPSILSYDVPANTADTNISMAVDGSGNIYALGWDSSVVLKCGPEGNSLSKFGAPAWTPGGWQRGLFYFPDAILIDSYGRIYVADTNGVQVFGVDEKYLYTIALDGGADAMAIDSEDNLYVVTYPAQVTKLAALKP